MDRVVVGSTNPVKVAATERVVAAVAETGSNAAAVGNVAVEPVPVDSGVSEQPRGRAETRTGAENRARRALDAAATGETADADYGVGIEGGVAEGSVGESGTPPGLWLVMWAAVTDGERLERGGGPSLRLPDPVAERVADGEELGSVLDDRLGTDGLKKEAGAAGVFTGGAIDRESALVHAVAGAFGPFVTGQYR